MHDGVGHPPFGKLDRGVVLPDLKHEVRADLSTRVAAGAARLQLGIAVPPLVESVGGHVQHARRARGDAQVAPLARLDVDADRAAGEHGHGRSAVSGVFSSPMPKVAIIASSRYSGPCAVGTNQPVGHMVSTSTNVK